VRQHFAQYPAQFLDVCWEKGDGWEKLCRFLGRDIPEGPFPHANRTNENAINPQIRSANLARIAEQQAKRGDRGSV
jgi:hypothetical protein